MLSYLAGCRNRQVLHPPLVKPAGSFIRSVQFGRLVDVNLAGLLGMGLTELLALVVVVQTGLEDATLAGEIGCTIQPQAGSQLKFIRVKEMLVRVLAKVQGSALPVDSHEV